MNNFLGHVAEQWQPTFENVAREFINDTLLKKDNNGISIIEDTGTP